MTIFCHALQSWSQISVPSEYSNLPWRRGRVCRDMFRSHNMHEWVVRGAQMGFFLEFAWFEGRTLLTTHPDSCDY